MQTAKILVTCLFLAAMTLFSNANVLAEEPETASIIPKNIRGDLDAAREGWERIENGALVIDVRSADEFEGGHLDGAINIVYTDTEALADAIGADQARSVVLYCGSGRRASLAQSALEERGFTGIFNASGLGALRATQP